MKRSPVVNLIFLTAAGMTACKEKPTRYCVDEGNSVVADWQCQDDQARHMFTHHWYYGGGHGFVSPGTRVFGGSTSVPAEGFSAPSESGTFRGGIGEAGERATAHGGEGGHGGGAGE